MRAPVFARLALACALLLSTACAVSAAKHAKDVTGVQVDDADGQFFITHDNQRWLVIDSEDDGKPFFFNPESQAAQWEDPRLPPIPDIDEAMLASLTSKPAKTSTTVWLVAAIPMLLFVGGLGGRIYYLHTYHPELLFPTKERKHRFRNNQKYRPQKSRGKLNQDNKGGRSNNT